MTKPWGRVVVACLAWVAAARAQPTDATLAEAAFRRGRELLQEGKTHEACAQFAESRRLEPKVGTLLNLAACQEQEGKVASATATYAEAVELAVRTGQAEREAFGRAQLAEARKKLSYLVVRPHAPRDGLRVSIDGKEVPSALFGTPLPMDPGDYAVTASAPEAQSWTATVHLGAGSVDVNVPGLESASRVATTAPPSRSISVLPIALLGVGIAAVGAGTAFGLTAVAKRNDSDTYCSGAACTQPGLDAIQQGRTAATISDVAFGVSVAALGAGLYFLIADRTAAPRPNAGLRVAPFVASGAGGALIRGDL
jgi:hypothetical protein